MNNNIENKLKELESLIKNKLINNIESNNKNISLILNKDISSIEKVEGFHLSIPDEDINKIYFDFTIFNKNNLSENELIKLKESLKLISIDFEKKQQNIILDCVMDVKDLSIEINQFLNENKSKINSKFDSIWEDTFNTEKSTEFLKTQVQKIK